MNKLNMTLFDVIMVFAILIGDYVITEIFNFFNIDTTILYMWLIIIGIAVLAIMFGMLKESDEDEEA